MRPQGFRGVAHLQVPWTAFTTEDQVYTEEVLGKPSHSAGHDVVSFLSSTEGGSERQHTEKPDVGLFTIAHTE